MDALIAGELIQSIHLYTMEVVRKQIHSEGKDRIHNCNKLVALIKEAMEGNDKSSNGSSFHSWGA